MLTFSFVVWGLIVGFVLGCVWAGTVVRTRLSAWSKSDQGFPYWVIVIVSAVIAATTAGISYEPYGYVASTILPIFGVIAGALALELCWGGIPAFFSFAFNTIERAVTASVAAVGAFKQSWHDTTPAKRTA